MAYLLIIVVLAAVAWYNVDTELETRSSELKISNPGVTWIMIVKRIFKYLTLGLAFSIKSAPKMVKSEVTLATSRTSYAYAKLEMETTNESKQAWKGYDTEIHDEYFAPRIKRNSREELIIAKKRKAIAAKLAKDL